VACVYAPTGAEDTFVVPAGVTAVQVEAVGAAGAPSYGGAAGGRGARVTGTLAGLAAGQTLYVAVGGAPTNRGACFPLAAGDGGFNGGGTSAYGGGGGGASDVRTAPRAAPTSLGTRRLVAAGGGGGGAPGFGCDETGAPGGDAGAAGGAATGGR
jgi:hypothetical protein